MSAETYSVCQFFDNDHYEYVRRNVSAEEAVEVSRHYTTNVVARLGIVVKRVIITDVDDSVVFEWKRGEGITWPPEARRPWPPTAATTAEPSP